MPAPCRHLTPWRSSNEGHVLRDPSTTRTRWVGAVAFALAIWVGPGCERMGQPDQSQLSRQIGPANPQQYEYVRSASDWKNPYLRVGPTAIEVIAAGSPAGRTV